MTLCPFRQFRDIFGKQGKGIHQYRFKGTSVVDYLIVIAFAFFVTYVTDIPLVLTTIGLLVLGIVSHVVVGMPTQSVKFLGLAC